MLLKIEDGRLAKADFLHSTFEMRWKKCCVKTLGTIPLGSEKDEYEQGHQQSY